MLVVTCEKQSSVIGFVAAAVIVLVSAERFANGLMRTGERLGIDQFLVPPDLIGGGEE